MIFPFNRKQNNADNWSYCPHVAFILNKKMWSFLNLTAKFCPVVCVCGVNNQAVFCCGMHFVLLYIAVIRELQFLLQLLFIK